MSKVYCGNLAWSVTDDELKNHMSSAGKIIFSKVIREPSGYSRGWGIVEYETPEEAEKAVLKFNLTEFRERNILCKIDTKYEKNEKDNSNELSVYVGNLPWKIDWKELRDIFKKYNNTYGTIIKDNNNRSRGYGILKFINKEDADLAIEEMNNSFVNGRQIVVKYNKF